MKIFFISTIYKEEEKKELSRLKNEIKQLGFNDYQIYIHSNIADNRGYAYGINRGIEEGIKAGAEIFCILNTDISVKNLKKDVILNGLKYYDIFGFAVNQDNKIYYGGELDQCRMSAGLSLKKPEKRYINVDFVSGSLMFIKKSAIDKIGLWDESYFLYYEDVDFCYRSKKAGLKLGIDTDNYYQHFEFSRRYARKDYFLAKNRLRFLLRYGSFKQILHEIIRSPKTILEYFPLFFSMGFKSKFLTNLFSLNLSSLLNKLFHFVLFIFLVKNLSPEKYGTYIIVWAFIGLFNPLIDLGTTNYGLVYLPKERLSMINNLVSMRFYIAGFIFLSTNIAAFFTFRAQPDIFLYIVLTSVVILSNVWSGSYLILNSVREKIIKSSLVSLIFNFIYIASVIIGLILKTELITIFIIIFISFLMYTVINYFLVKNEINRFKLTIDVSVWKRVLSKSYIFILISFVAGLYFKHNVFLLNYFKTESAVGIYSSGYKFLDAFSLFAASYNITVIPIFSKLISSTHLLKKKLIKDFLLLSIVGSLVVITFYFLGPLVLPMILKGGYLSGIKVAQIVIFALPFMLITSIFYNLLYAFEMARYVFYIFLIQVTLNFILNLILIPIYSYFASAWITVFSEALSMLLAYYFVRRKLKQI